MDIDRLAYKHLNRKTQFKLTPVYDRMKLIFGEKQAKEAILQMAETLQISSLVVARPSVFSKIDRKILYQDPRYFIVVADEESRAQIQNTAANAAQDDGIKFSTAQPGKRPDNGHRLSVLQAPHSTPKRQEWRGFR